MNDSNTNDIVAGFTEDEATRLTGISLRQLRYWADTGFFVPGLQADAGSDAAGRMYSFRDLVCLQALNALRNEAKVPLPHLRDVKATLAHLGDEVWSRTTLYVLGKKVVFVNPQTHDREQVTTGQKLLEIPLEVIRADLSDRVRAMRARRSDGIGRIERVRGVVRNRPVIAGTRIPVASIKAFHDAGYDLPAIIREYPALIEEDVRAALAYGEAA